MSAGHGLVHPSGSEVSDHETVLRAQLDRFLELEDAARVVKVEPVAEQPVPWSLSQMPSRARAPEGLRLFHEAYIVCLLQWQGALKSDPLLGSKLIELLQLKKDKLKLTTLTIGMLLELMHHSQWQVRRMKDTGRIGVCGHLRSGAVLGCVCAYVCILALRSGRTVPAVRIVVHSPAFGGCRRQRVAQGHPHQDRRA